MREGFEVDGREIDTEFWGQGIISPPFFDFSDKQKVFENKMYIEEKLTEIFSQDILDAEEIANALFPQEDVDIFLSHSFSDRDKAHAFAAAMNRIGLQVFIDSYVWESAYDLLRKIDDRYCYQHDLGTYSYEHRNKSTSHVYMILTTALHKMIDRSESFFFLQTENSIADLQSKKPVEPSASKTYSPWIHSELMFSSMVRRKQHRDQQRPILESVQANRSVESFKSLKVAHHAEKDHLIKIDGQELESWVSRCRGERQQHPLDTLYKYVECRQLING